MSLTCPPETSPETSMDGRAAQSGPPVPPADRDFGLADPGELPGYRVGDLPG